MSVLVVAQSSSEIPEGLMNNPVLLHAHSFFGSLWIILPVPVAARSKALVYGRSSVEIVRAWMFVCPKRCVLSGRGLCDGLITRPEESYRMWCVVLCDLETS